MTTARFMLALSLSFAALCGRAESIDLSGVYQLAIENDPQLGAAEASFLAQSEVVPQARAGLLPSLNLSSSYSDTTSPSLRDFNPLTGTTLFEDTTTTSRSWRAGLVQPLFRMDRWHQYQQSKSIRDQAQAGYSSEALSLIVRVAETYLAILEAQDALDSTNAERSAVQRQLEQVQQRFDVGLVAITDVLESTASFDRTTVNVIEAEGAQAQSFEPLMRLTGRAFTSVQGLMAEFPVRHPEPQNEAAWVAAALEKNTTILAGKAALAVAQKQAAINKSRHLPTLDAQVTYSSQTSENPSAFQTNRSDTEVYGLQLTVPIYSGGGTRSGVRQSEYRLVEARENLDLAERQVSENVRGLFTAINTDVARVKASLRGIESARSALSATETGYEVGTRNIVDVLLAQQRLYLSDFQFASARYRYINNTLRLKQVIGHLTAEDLYELNQFIDVERLVTQVNPTTR